MSDSETLADVGEFETIARLVARFPANGSVLVGPGDDAAQVQVGDGRVLLATDVLVDGRHFRRDWSAAADVGHRAAAQSLSDLNAMGGGTTAIVVGVTAPPDLPVRWLLDLCDGLVEECHLVGAVVVGGDLTRADVLSLSVAAVGAVDGPPVLRSGARPGDVVAMTGRQGWSAAGLAVLQRGFRSPRAVVDAYRRPEVPYGEGARAAASEATAMIDISDGLVADVDHVARASGVAVDLHRAALGVDEPVQAVGAALGVDPLQFVLGGGDDHALVACFGSADAVPQGWRVVGEVADGAGVTVDGAPYAAAAGWTHF
jgi:thiamine-monophosphate kinase